MASLVRPRPNDVQTLYPNGLVGRRAGQHAVADGAGGEAEGSDGMMVGLKRARFSVFLKCANSARRFYGQGSTD